MSHQALQYLQRDPSVKHVHGVTVAERVGGDLHRERHAVRRGGVHRLIDPRSDGPVGDLPQVRFFRPAGAFVTPLQGDLQCGHHGLQLADIPASESGTSR